MSESELVKPNDGSYDSGKYNLASLIPYAGTYIVFLGVVRLITYYESFGIQILGFLEISEVITSFLDIILAVIASFV